MNMQAPSSHCIIRLISEENPYVRVRKQANIKRVMGDLPRRSYPPFCEKLRNGYTQEAKGVGVDVMPPPSLGPPKTKWVGGGRGEMDRNTMMRCYDAMQMKLSCYRGKIGR